jgi:hypothetical protein
MCGRALWAEDKSEPGGLVSSAWNHVVPPVTWLEVRRITLSSDACRRMHEGAPILDSSRPSSDGGNDGGVDPFAE